MSLTVLSRLAPDSGKKNFWYLSGHRNNVLAVAKGSHGVFATCDEKGLGLLWQHDALSLDGSPSHVGRITTEGPAIVDACFLLSTRLCTAQGDGRVVLWDVEKGTGERSFSRAVGRLGAANWPVINAVTTWGGKCFAYGGDDGHLALADVSMKEPLTTFNLRVPVTCVAVSNNSLLVGDVLGTIRCYDTRVFKGLYSFQGHSDVVTSLSLNGDASVVISYGMDNALFCWNALSFALNTEDRLLYRGAFNQGNTRSLLRCDWDEGGAVVVPINDGHVIHLNAPKPGNTTAPLPARHRWEPVRCAAFVSNGCVVSSAETEVILQQPQF
uniref:Uncharacterized protein TCIL3000_11_11810 n=1 Tax=Trypanosoma congolense (strain IL3000) TaxID=1068625 RepID=G0V217_TRYCI|nr:unnamed protein product [Trypanosoma congolense IL3000]